MHVRELLCRLLYILLTNVFEVFIFTFKKPDCKMYWYLDQNLRNIQIKKGKKILLNLIFDTCSNYLNNFV